MPLNTFKVHSKLWLWVCKSSFANLLYMNACRSFWMVNAVGGAVSMETVQCTLFLALTLVRSSLLICCELEGNSLITSGGQEEMREAAFLYTATSWTHWVVLCLPCAISSSLLPWSLCRKMYLQHTWQRANFLSIEGELISDYEKYHNTIGKQNRQRT